MGFFVFVVIVLILLDLAAPRPEASAFARELESSSAAALKREKWKIVVSQFRSRIFELDEILRQVSRAVKESGGPDEKLLFVAAWNSVNQAKGSVNLFEFEALGRFSKESSDLEELRLRTEAAVVAAGDKIDRICYIIDPTAVPY